MRRKAEEMTEGLRLRRRVDVAFTCRRGGAVTETCAAAAAPHRHAKAQYVRVRLRANGVFATAPDPESAPAADERPNRS